MSTQALQRVYVRMLFDPALVERVHANGAEALADVPLTESERRWLVATDRRLFTADPLRRRRALKALLDEYKASAALAVSATGRLATLDAFFSSSIFHACIQERRSLALSFGDYLVTLAPHDPRIAAAATLERGLAKARRGRVPSGKAGRFATSQDWVLAPNVEPLDLPQGTLGVVQAVEQVLFEISLAPVAALAEDGPNLAAVPQLGSGREKLLAVRGEGEHVSLEEASDELFALLEAARNPTSGAALVALARSLGASPGTEGEVLDPLVADRLLVPSA